MLNQPETAPPGEPEALRESLQDFALIAMDAEGTIVQWSGGAEKVFGYRESEILGRPFAALFPPEDQATGVPSAELNRAVRDGMSEDERWHMRNDGARIWASGITRAVRNDKGELTGFSKLARDITTQKLAQLQRETILAREHRAREEAELRWKILQEISETIPAYIALVRLPDQVYVFANRLYRTATGDRELIGRRLREAHPELGGDVFDNFERVAATREAYRSSEHRVKDRYYDLSFEPMHSEAAGYPAILIFAMDVTERVEARHDFERLTFQLQSEGERLKEEVSERKRAEDLAGQRAQLVQKQAAMINLARDAILAMRMDGSVEMWNSGAEEMYGWKESEVLGRNIHEVLKTAFPHGEEEVDRQLIANGHWNGELKHTCRDGREVDVSSRWVLWQRDGKPYGWLEINRDITHNKRMEAHLRDTQKMESLGVLAGGIAHDFNNLLTGIMGNVSLALDLSDRDSNIGNCLTNALRASEQAAFLTKQILAYAGKGQFILQEADLSAVVRDTMALIGSSIPRSVAIDQELARALPCVTADASQLQQVAMNLIFNAAEAIGERPGRIVIRTRAQEVTDTAEPGSFDIGPPAPGLCAVLEVEDNGPGLGPMVRRNMFDPFYTTKFTGRGLGLAAVSGIVRTLNGGVQVASVEGQGTVFRVFLPAGASSGDGARPVEPILVVDDEEIVRRTAESMLKNRGYRVLLAEDGRQALELVRRAPSKVALVLLDMAMPVMGGEETFRELKRIRPDLPVLVSSGYSEDEAIRRFGGLGVAGFIQKPYTLGALVDKVSALLNR
jgi:PAS domain S-box-containing protein